MSSRTETSQGSRRISESSTAFVVTHFESDSEYRRRHTMLSSHEISSGSKTLQCCMYGHTNADKPKCLKPGARTIKRADRSRRTFGFEGSSNNFRCLCICVPIMDQQTKLPTNEICSLLPVRRVLFPDAPPMHNGRRLFRTCSTWTWLTVILEIGAGDYLGEQSDSC